MKKLFLIILIYVSLSATNAISTELGDYQGLLDDIITLNELGNLNEAISKTDLMVKNYAAQSETYSQLRTYVANALFNKANILSRQAILNNDKEKYLEAISSYDLLLTLYDKYQDANLQFYIVLALVVKGEQLEALQKYDLAINCYDKAIERLIFEPDQLTQAQIAQAMINKGVIKFEHKKFDEALSSFNAVSIYLGVPISETLQEKVALAFYFKSAIFRDLNKLDDEIANYQEFINFFHRESTHATEKLQEIFSKIEKLRNIALEKKKAK